MQKIKCWRLETVGKQSNLLVARFASREEAVAAKSGAAGYGPEIVEEEITVFDTAVEFDPTLDTVVAQSGLAKLSPQEKAALGLKEKS